MSTNHPPRSLDTMSDAIAMSSPSGRSSAASKRRASLALSNALFGPGGLERPGLPPKPTQKEADLRHARFLRDLASRSKRPRRYIRNAEMLEALHAEPDQMCTGESLK